MSIIWVGEWGMPGFEELTVTVDNVLARKRGDRMEYRATKEDQS